MRMGRGLRTGLGHGGITCVLQTQFSSFSFYTAVQNAYQTTCVVVRWEKEDLQSITK